MISKFRFWCNKVLPMVYDNSLSYYELLCKVVDKLNETIDSQNDTQQLVANFIEAVTSDLNEIRTYLDTELGEQNTKIDNAIAAFQAEIDDFEGDVMGNITALTSAFDDLQEYVDDYFDNLDISEEVQEAFNEYVADHDIVEMVETLNKPKILFVGANLETSLIVSAMDNEATKYNFNVGQTGGINYMDEQGGDSYIDNLTNVDERTDLSVNAAGWYNAASVTHVVVTTPAHLWNQFYMDATAFLDALIAAIKTTFINAKILLVETTLPSAADANNTYQTIAAVENWMCKNTGFEKTFCDLATKPICVSSDGDNIKNLNLAKHILNDAFCGVDYGKVYLMSFSMVSNHYLTLYISPDGSYYFKLTDSTTTTYGTNAVFNYNYPIFCTMTATIMVASFYISAPGGDYTFTPVRYSISSPSQSYGCNLSVLSRVPSDTPSVAHEITNITFEWKSTY